MPSGYVEFEFDLPGALLVRLVEVLGELGGATLDVHHLQDIPEAQGVYQLLLDDQIVYIGKTDAKAGLRKRLERHARKIQQRVGLTPERVSFKAVRIFVFTTVDLETQLITHYGGLSAVPWNGSGFGSNDPGRRRDTTEYKHSHFDSLFPIDINRALDLDMTLPRTAASIFGDLKKYLPYLFRFENHLDLIETLVSESLDDPMTTKSLIENVVSQLPPKWQATKLPSHVILYKEAPRSYHFGDVIAVSPESPPPA